MSIEPTLRSLFAVALIIHGLIHVLGVAREWKIVKENRIPGARLLPPAGQTATMAGVCWLAACIAFVLAGTLLLVSAEGWWRIAVIGMVISQVLIIVFWKEARAGTIVNAALFPVLLVSYAGWQFNETSHERVLKIYEAPFTEHRRAIIEKDITSLPPCVQEWLWRSGVIGKKPVHAVRLKQLGAMRTSPDASWTPVETEQYFRVNPPAFLWNASVHSAPFITVRGRDSYADGKGRMQIKLLSMVPIADSKGDEIDQGTMVRYLAETAWFPSAALENYLRWETIDSVSAKVTMTYGGDSASGVFRFDSGDVVGFEAQRYMEADGKHTPEIWSIAMKGHRSFEGIRIPAESEVTWKLKRGDFTWFTLVITELEYDKPALY
ncbi:MAG: DUF6544 family protein [Bacteroidota bacterium]